MPTPADTHEKPADDKEVKSAVEGDRATMDIDARLVSRLIGPKGQNLSSMMDQSGAYLAVKEVSPGVNKVVITGFPDCVAKGRELVETGRQQS
ncbi:unnamed protein product [Durusdinium trenchii]|uniref:K Homology domain-containing protein n=1 Tax=Durusdinium trenchii TaxID=1381693 RepID=A0ABP0NGH9_9DINO